MQPNLFTALALIAFGVAVLIGGNRLWLIGAAAGALLGVGLLNLFNVAYVSWVALFMVIGFAVALGIAAVVFKGFASLIIMALGFFAGGAIVLAILDMFNLNSLGLLAWIAALVGGAVGAVLARRFQAWAFIAIAAIVGALLILRGAQILIPTLDGTIASLLAIVIAGAGIFYHARKRPAEKQPAK